MLRYKRAYFENVRYQKYSDISAVLRDIIEFKQMMNLKVKIIDRKIISLVCLTQRVSCVSRFKLSPESKYESFRSFYRTSFMRAK